LLSHYVQSIASPAAAWQLRYIFIFLMKIKKLSQPPQVPFMLKELPAALTCTKNINDCPEAALNFKDYAGQSFIFFAPLFSLHFTFTET
jgi:hypothetical protein